MLEFDPGRILKKRYIIEALIGKGGMGKVYLATARKHPGLRFAIKELLDVFPSMEERLHAINALKKECEMLSNLRHPRLPRIVEQFSEYEKEYLVMEYVEGITLEEKITQSNYPLDERDALLIAIQLAEVLHFLHTVPPYPIIYRDLKPSNIILQPGQNINIKLVDFGVARFYHPDKSGDTVRFGSPGYAAPEQYRREIQSIPRSDIYSLGVIMHQLLTLHDPTLTPFKFSPIRSINPLVTEQLEWIILKALERDPAKRYQDMDFFREELKEYYRDNFGILHDDYLPELTENRHITYLPDMNISKLAVASLVTGVLSIYGCQCGPLGFPFSVAALITGYMAKRNLKIREKPNSRENYMLTGGMICGGIGVLLQLLYLFLIFYP